MILRMIKKTKLKKIYFIVAFISIFMLSALVPNPVIGSDEVQAESPFTPRASAGPYKAALMIGGDETDYGFSYVGIQAIEYLEDTFGWEISISRQVAYNDMYRIASEYGDDGYDVIFMIGGQFIEISYFSGIADIYNETLFVQIPGLNQWVPAPDNVVGLHPSFQTEGHYLAGVLAGQMTETDRLGVVFGEWYEYLAMEFYAFKAGVESVNGDAKVYARVAGTWGDAALGKQITESLIDIKNVDIIVQVAETTGRGVIAACVEANITVIGTVADQAVLAPDHTMTSIGMNTTLLMEIVAQRIENGTAMDVLGGTSWDLPIGNYLYPYHNYDAIIPQSVKEVVDNAIAGIANGSIEVPRFSTDNPPPDEIPATPTITTTTKTIKVDNINLKWASSADTDLYRVYIGDTEIGDTTTTSLNIEFEGNGTYTITVTAVNALGESEHSSSIIITVEIPLTPPGPPTINTLSQTIIYDNITVQWNSVSGADNYNVYVDGLFNETTSITEQNVMLWVNGTYTITVTAVNALGESELSNEILIIYISLNPPVLITTSQTIIKEDISIEWNNVENAASYYIYVNGTINETTSETTQVVMLGSSGSYTITVTAVMGILESDESELIIIVVELPSGNEGYTIPGYNFALIPTVLLGLVILILKIRYKKNHDAPN